MNTRSLIISSLFAFCFLTFSIVPALPAEILLAHYPFDDGTGSVVQDISGSNHHGSLFGPVWVQARLAGGLQFDGQDDRVDLGHLDITGSAVTLMAWVKIDSFTGTSGDGRIISKADGIQENNHYWMLSTISDQGTKLRFRLKTNGTTTTLIGGDVTTDTWLHAAAVYDGSYMRLYLDGTQVASTAKSGAVSQNSSLSAWIGDQPPAAGTKPWSGVIDDVRIYESALTQSEIQFAMNNGNDFPLITLTAPSKGQSFASGEIIQLTANASDPDGTIQRVEFLAGLNKIGESLTSPYQASWQSAADGTYQITAKAIDNEGSFTISSPPHQIIVGNSGAADAWIHKSTETGDLELPTPSGNQQTATLTLDVNRDGITDFVIADRNTQPSVVWYESSNAGTWLRRVVEPDALRIEAGGSYTDIDGDGDLDILFAGDGSSNQVWWWENPYPDFSSRWQRRYVKNSGSNKYHDQLFGDFDGDGAMELASWNQHSAQLLLFEIPVNPKNSGPWPFASISPASSSHEGMAVYDVDNDGTDDIVGAGRWYRHASGTNYSEFVVDASQTYGRSAAGQFIPGGFAELVFGPGDSSGDLKFYQFIAGSWKATLLKSNVDHGHSLHTADFNNDGLLDIFCAEMRLDGSNEDAKSWIFYGDGKGSFTESIVAEGIGNHESRPADLDGDGDIDILGKPYNWDAPRLDIWLNHGAGSQALSLDTWQRHLIDGAMPANSVFIDFADINGDRLIDLVAGGWWWQNPGSLGGSWIRHTIGGSLNNMAAVYDIDSDGDIDILGTTGVGSSSSYTFQWASNNGSGSFNIYDNIQSGGGGDFLQGCLIDDFGAGKQAVLSWHNGGGGLQGLTIPAAPQSTQWSFSTLSSSTLQEDLSSGDIDNDGDRDLLLGTAWLENNEGTWIRHTLGQVSDLHSGAEADRNDLADIDGDGRLDAVIALENGTSVVWFKSPAAVTGHWQRNIVGTVAGQGFSMDVADFDNDSDPDIVIGEHRGTTSNRVIIFENNDNGTTWTQHIIDSDSTDTIDHHNGTQAVDLDLDGDLDIISLGWYNKKVWIYENKAIDGNNSGSAPVIISQPADVSAYQGQTVTFSVTAAGTGALSYQWHRNGAAVPYATSSTLQTWPLSLGDDGNVYSCTVKNRYGQAVSSDATLTVSPATGTGGWWNDNWRFRIPITIDPESTERTELPIAVNLNFTDLISSSAVSGDFNPDSLRVVEATSSGVIINENVAFQFEPANNFNSSTLAAGDLVFLLHGNTGESEIRYFHTYFDTADRGHHSAFIPTYVSASDNLSHKGFNTIKVDSQNSSWFFHKTGGGFASLLDSEENDWINFVNDPGSSASGWYRGIPNAVYPEDMMHPGRSGCLSTLSHQGPVRATLESACSGWSATWYIYPYFAQMSMISAAHEYWFQYEGTPGGSTEETDFIITSDGTETTATDEFTTDLEGEEWAYLGDSDLDRVLFLSHRENDDQPDRFYRMEGGGGDGMIIFAFGRGSGTDRHLTEVPEHFILGLLESKNYPENAASIRGATQNVSITMGDIEGIALPKLDISNVYFGNTAPGDQADKTITLSNHGSADLEIGQIAVANPVTQPFYIASDSCSNQKLSPGESCVVIISFLPPDTNSYTESFDIPVNSHPSFLTVYLYSGKKPFPWSMFAPALSKE